MPRFTATVVGRLRVTVLAMFALGLAWAGPVSADLLVYECFNYTNCGVANWYGARGSFGFSGGWLNNSAASTGSVAATEASLAYPASTGLTGAGRRVADSDGAGVYRLLDPGLRIDLNGRTNEATRYFSVLFRKSNGGASGDYLGVGWCRGYPPPGGAVGDSDFVAATGANSADLATLYTYGLASQSVSSTSLVTGTETTFAIVKLVAHTNNSFDAYLQVFGPADAVGAEPSTWSAVDTKTNITNTGTELQIDRIGILSKSIHAVEIDEIRMGETWADVTRAPLQVVGAAQDVYIVSNDPNVCYNSTGRVNVGVYVRNNAGPTRAGFLQFVLPALQPKQYIRKAVIAGIWSASRTLDVTPAVIVGLATNPVMTNLTWNSAISAGYITGRDGTDYHVLWGANATVFGETWPASNQVLRAPGENAFTNRSAGLLKFLNDRASVGGPAPVTLGLGGPTGDTDYSFGFLCMEGWDFDADPRPGIFTPHLTLVMSTPEAPAAGVLMILR